MITSAKPSPLTSPAAPTQKPEKSPCSSPLIWKPLLPLSVESSSVAGNPDGAAEHHVARAGVFLTVQTRERRPYDDVVEAVAVDVAGQCNREAAVVTGNLAVDSKAIGPVQARQLYDARKLWHPRTPSYQCKYILRGKLRDPFSSVKRQKAVTTARGR